MPNVKIAIAGRNHQVQCEPGQEADLKVAAERLDAEAQDIASKAGRMPEARLMLLTALVLSDRVNELEGRVRAAERRAAEAGAAPAGLRPLVERAEALAKG
ncbi:MAG: cell division protein ZapA [Paracoccaceae bacterium]